MKSTSRGVPGRPHGRGVEELDSAALDFEERLKEFTERLGSITPIPTDPARGFEAATGTDDEGPRPAFPIGPDPVAEPRDPVSIEPATDGAPRLAAEALEAYVRRLTLGLSRAMRRVSSRSDAEAIHDLRVHARRLVAVLRVWREQFRRGFRRRALKNLRGLRRRLGEAREIEVYSELLEAHALQGTSPGRELVELALHQARRRLDPARRRASRMVRGIEPGELIEALDDAARRIPARHVRHPEGANEARARVERRAGDALTAVRAAVELPDNATLHEARVALKKWRYSSEALDAGLALPEEPRIRSVREMQEALGVVQDRASLRRELLPDGAFTEAPEALAPFLEDMEADRREAIGRFLALANRLLNEAGVANR